MKKNKKWNEILADVIADILLIDTDQTYER